MRTAAVPSARAALRRLPCLLPATWGASLWTEAARLPVFTDAARAEELMGTGCDQPDRNQRRTCLDDWYVAMDTLRTPKQHLEDRGRALIALAMTVVAIIGVGRLWQRDAISGFRTPRSIRALLLLGSYCFLATWPAYIYQIRQDLIICMTIPQPIPMVFQLFRI